MHVCFEDLTHHKSVGYFFILNIFSENQWEFEDQMEVNNRSSISRTTGVLRGTLAFLILLQRKIKKKSFPKIVSSIVKMRTANI